MLPAWRLFHNGKARIDRFHGCLLGLAVGDAVGTTAAMCGQVAGAFYGASGIPDKWLEKLAKRDMIEQMADSCLLFSSKGSSDRGPVSIEG